ncbi:hypothetical protein K469DRAFT_713153 [Zopfia rhizophila CBS 207.26]|uniref:Uncharacterized protein n=1 Tax=Zopfia rhizophila CBS 207.26 TaxID=1314779 RepID=A0A6A6DWL3_9PEZI|nr:hypothetical protein K469DRAFT_713153 [Zopfia rhizophila CBS 207.26]
MARRWRMSHLHITLGKPQEGDGEERRELGTERRVRKVKATAKEHKLRRPLKIPQKVPDDMVDKSNPTRSRPLHIQMQHFNVNAHERTIERNLNTSKNKAQLYVAGYTKTI